MSDARTPAGWANVIRKVKQEGFDALVYRNAYEGQGGDDSFVVFDADLVEIVPGDS